MIGAESKSQANPKPCGSWLASDEASLININFR
jgi:hypothetical protein